MSASMWMSDSSALLHHALGLHHHRLQVDRGDFHARALLRCTNWVLQGLCAHGAGEQAQRGNLFDESRAMMEEHGISLMRMIINTVMITLLIYMKMNSPN
jgi:hypothetical protein